MKTYAIIYWNAAVTKQLTAHIKAKSAFHAHDILRDTRTVGIIVSTRKVEVAE